MSRASRGEPVWSAANALESVLRRQRDALCSWLVPRSLLSEQQMYWNLFFDSSKLRLIANFCLVAGFESEDMQAAS